MSGPRVSIAMTTFNAGPFLADQLQSFAVQSRPPDQLVVCDDGSTDGTLDALEDYARRTPFEVRIERNLERLETTPNFERAVSLSDGDVVLLADQDDIWMPDKIETVLGVFRDHPQAGVIFSNGCVVDEDRRSLHYTLWESLWFDAAEQAKVREGRGLEVFVRHVVAAGTTLAFRGLYRDLVLPFPSLRDCHDAWICFLITSVSELCIIDRPLIDYRLHASNQFGLKKLGLREQLDKAREQLEKAAFSHNVQFFSAARQRLAEQSRAPFRATERAFELIDAKIAHARRRDAMSRRLWRRLPVILQEILNGGYWRYSYGIKSIAQDVWLR